MTQMQLPAHLQGRQATGVTARAVEGLGSSLPPHLSIQGNKFTFIDASGNEAPPMLMFEGYIIDVSDVMCKRYYDKKYDQNATSYEPPVCWSANGIGPSREASRPQAMSCESCDKNVRGSAISQMSGAAIKACRDEKWIAIMNPSFGAMVFQLVVTPGSFKNWKGFVAQLENYKVDPHWVLTRFSFEDKTNGVLQFTMVNWTAPEHLAVIDAALAERKTDAIVGRLDQPRTAALPAPQQGTATTLPPNTFAPVSAGTGVAPVFVPPAMVAPQEIIPPGAQVRAPFSPPGGFAPPVPNPPTGTAPGFETAPPSVPNAFPSNPAPEAPQPTTQRRRRNAAVPVPVAQNPAPAAPQAPFAAPAAPPFGSPPTPNAPSAPTAPANTFGISHGAPVNPEMSQMLAGLFPNQGSAG